MNPDLRAGVKWLFVWLKRDIQGISSKKNCSVENLDGKK
jgi:hypothetical protein